MVEDSANKSNVSYQPPKMFKCISNITFPMNILEISKYCQMPDEKNNNIPIYVNAHLCKRVYTLASFICHKSIGLPSRTRNQNQQSLSVQTPLNCVPWNNDNSTGHYYMYAKDNLNSNDWFLYNDHKVGQCESEDAMLRNDGENTYMLMYC